MTYRHDKRAKARRTDEPKLEPLMSIARVGPHQANRRSTGSTAHIWVAANEARRAQRRLEQKEKYRNV